MPFNEPYCSCLLFSLKTRCSQASLSSWNTSKDITGPTQPKHDCRTYKIPIPNAPFCTVTLFFALINTRTTKNWNISSIHIFPSIPFSVFRLLMPVSFLDLFSLLLFTFKNSFISLYSFQIKSLLWVTTVIRLKYSGDTTLSTKRWQSHTQLDI